MPVLSDIDLAARLTPELLATLFVAAVAVAALIAVVVVLAAVDGSRRRRAARLARVAGTPEPAAAPGRGRSSLRNAESQPVHGLLRYLPRRDLLRQRLQRAGFEGGVGAYAGVAAGLALTVTLAAAVLGGQAPAAALLFGIAAGAVLPYAALGWLARRREQAFLKNLPEAIDIMIRGLKAGLPVSESMEAVGKEAVEPVGGLFRRVCDLVRIGYSLEDAIARVSKRMAVPELRFLAITLSVQKETGGNLTETLHNLSEILRRRRQMKLKIRAVSSEARASATILGSLPFVMFALIYAVNSEYLTMLFTDPRGNVMLGVGLGSIAIGVVVMAKMVRFDI